MNDHESGWIAFVWHEHEVVPHTWPSWFTTRLTRVCGRYKYRSLGLLTNLQLGRNMSVVKMMVTELFGHIEALFKIPFVL